jgi:hypothetical protein
MGYVGAALFKRPNGEATAHSYDYDFSSAWSMANSQFEYFSNPNNGFINGEVIRIGTIAEMDDAVRNKNVQIGDMVYWGNDESVHHAAMITGFSKDEKTDKMVILYSAHTESRSDEKITAKQLEDENIYIIRIKDDA